MSSPRLSATFLAIVFLGIGLPRLEARGEEPEGQQNSPARGEVLLLLDCAAGSETVVWECGGCWSLLPLDGRDLLLLRDDGVWRVSPGARKPARRLLDVEGLQALVEVVPADPEAGRGVEITAIRGLTGGQEWVSVPLQAGSELRVLEPQPGPEELPSAEALGTREVEPLCPEWSGPQGGWADAQLLQPVSMGEGRVVVLARPLEEGTAPEAPADCPEGATP